MCVRGGLKTETGKLHEILTSVCGGSKNFFIPPQKLLVCVGGGLKIETGKFLLHFQNSKSSNRCRSVYGTNIINGVQGFFFVIADLKYFS